jgi:hypothetical protein
MSGINVTKVMWHSPTVFGDADNIPTIAVVVSALPCPQTRHRVRLAVNRVEIDALAVAAVKKATKREFGTPNIGRPTLGHA